jgi:hypothetical protein
MNELQPIEPASRRSLLRGATIAALGLTAAGLLAPRRAAATIPSTIPGTGDIQVLNYALLLEDLEAELYAQALIRLGSTAGTSPKASSSVGTIQPLSVTGPDVTYITEFAPVEAAHRDFLIGVITNAGSTPITVSSPFKYDFGIQNATRQQVLDTVLEAEATGVQAYLGAITYFSTKSPYLPTAAAIQGTEARHTSVLTIVRNLLSSQGLVNDPIAPVAPLRGDPAITPTAGNYNNSLPNQGTGEGRDLAMDPSEVYNRVSGFIKTS